MTLTGHISNGVVVLDGNPSVPDGLPVRVILPDAAPVPKDSVRLPIPLVRTTTPGSVILTGEDIAAILEGEDVASARR